MEKQQQADQDFISTLVDIDDGRVNEQLDRGIREVVRACQTTAKSGGVTLQITVKPSGNGQAYLSAAVKLKVPQPATMPTCFFATDDGGLTREDPKQLKLRHVEAKPCEIRIVGAGAPGKAKE